MDPAMIDEHLENLDRRLAAVEQILPTLATTAELRRAISGAIADAVAPLATRAELDDRLAAQATGLRQEVRDEGERSRRHMDVLIEGQRQDIQLLAEHLSEVMSRLTGGRHTS